MIKAILDILFNLVDWIKTAFEFLLDFVVGLGNLAGVLQDIANDLPGYFTWFPPAVVSMISITLVIVVFYKFFGRT